MSFILISNRIFYPEATHSGVPMDKKMPLCLCALSLKISAHLITTQVYTQSLYT